MYEQPASTAPNGVLVDLRSDTVTLPSPAMRDAIARAEVGDDVYGEDPTVNRLESLAAEMVGKEAAVLVTSGTMGNLASMLALAPRGRRVILGDESHILHYEAGGAAALGGLIYDTLPTAADGTLPLDRLRIAAEPSDDLHRAPPGLIALENTHNRCGGRVLHLEYLAAVHAIADEYDLPLHLDGARVFNAAVALDVDVRRITRHVHTLQFCLSKGLAAPVGSIVAGPQTFVDNVRRVRKMLGGGMRQAGIIAAAGIVALEQMIERLAEDHRHARLLAEGLATIPGLRIDPELVETDIVRFELLTEHPTVPEFMATLAQRGILIGDLGGRFLRAVTHYGITAADVQQTVAVVRDVLA